MKLFYKSPPNSLGGREESFPILPTRDPKFGKVAELAQSYMATATGVAKMPILLASFGPPHSTWEPDMEPSVPCKDASGSLLCSPSPRSWQDRHVMDI